MKNKMTEIVKEEMWFLCDNGLSYDRFECELRFIEVIPEIAKRLSGIHPRINKLCPG